VKKLSLSPNQLQDCRKKIVHGIRDAVGLAKARGVVLGMSGGVDSSVTAKLAAEAVKDVYALMLPERGVNDPKDLKDAVRLAEQLGIRHTVIEINEALNAISEHFPWESFNTSYKKKAVANIRPRIRMIYNYLTANLDGRLVLGTSNKTELLLGYFTKYGDGGCDLEPIGGLYKTQVLQLAKYIGIPDCIACKTPTAGLWKGQTDESEIGMKYSEIDAILHSLVDCGLSIDETAKKTGLKKAMVESIADKMAGTQHKRCMPGIIEV